MIAARSPAAPQPLAFGPRGAQLFGLCHAPPPGRARGAAVLLCAPLGYEAICTHRTFRHLAERLAWAGFHALRFDYHGTGDSSGHADDPGRVRAWIKNIAVAIEELKSLSGAREVDLLGLRAGGMLASLAAATRPDVQSLVLWAPCVSGSAYVRELRAFQGLKGAGARSASGALPRAGEEIAGYWFDDTTLDDLAAIDLLAKREWRSRRALVLPRDDMKLGHAPLVAHLDACGVETTVRVAPGYAEMMLDPQETVVPFEALDAIVSWLGARPSLVLADQPPVGTLRSLVLADQPPVGTLRSRRDGSRHVVAPRSDRLQASSPKTRALVSEEPVRFGDRQRLFGILTDPRPDRARAGRPAVVFLNVGANHRVGPNRMYVSLARDLAALGYACLRFDRAGLGDSAARDGAAESLLGSGDAVGDVKAAMSFLAHARGVERVVLVGVCSGAHLAFHAALADRRVAGQVLINPPTFAWTPGVAAEVAPPPTFKSTRYYLEAPRKAEVWARAARGEVDVRGVATVLWERLSARGRTAAGHLVARWRGHPAPQTDIEAAFWTLSGRGVESLLVFSASDAGLDMIEDHLGAGASRVRACDNVQLVVVPDADHTFTAVRSQQEIQALVSTFVERAFP